MRGAMAATGLLTIGIGVVLLLIGGALLVTGARDLGALTAIGGVVLAGCGALLLNVLGRRR